MGILQELNFLETEKSWKHIKQNGWNQGERSCRLLACHLKQLQQSNVVSSIKITGGKDIVLLTQ